MMQRLLLGHRALMFACCGEATSQAGAACHRDGRETGNRVEQIRRVLLANRSGIRPCMHHVDKILIRSNLAGQNK
jgi:hypothetical protein